MCNTSEPDHTFKYKTSVNPQIHTSPPPPPLQRVWSCDACKSHFVTPPLLSEATKRDRCPHQAEAREGASSMQCN